MDARLCVFFSLENPNRQRMGERINEDGRQTADRRTGFSLSDSGPQMTDGGWTVDGGRWTITGSTGFPARQTCKPAPQADMLHGIIRTSRPARSQVPVPFLRDLPDGARQEVKRGNPLRRPQGRLLPQGLCRKGDGMRPIARVRGRSPGCDESRWHHETPLVLRERASF